MEADPGWVRLESGHQLPTGDWTPIPQAWGGGQRTLIGLDVQSGGKNVGPAAWRPLFSYQVLLLPSPS